MNKKITCFPLFFLLVQVGLCREDGFEAKISFGGFGSVTLGDWIERPSDNLDLEVKNHKLFIGDKSKPQKGFAEFGKPNARFFLLSPEKRKVFFSGNYKFEVLGMMKISNDVEMIALVTKMNPQANQ